MKNIKLTTSQAIAAICLLSAVFLCGCSTRGVKERLKDFENANTIVIDSCEYLVSKSPIEDFGWVMTHKGNCKFCRAWAEKHCR